MIYYSRYIKEFIADTAHLSLMEQGVYDRLLDKYYLDESPIPDDKKYRWTRATTDAEIAAVDAVLDEFFTLVDGHWHNKRADQDIVECHAKASTSRENGKLGGRPKKTQNEPKPNLEGTKEEPNQNLEKPRGFISETQEEPSRKPFIRQEPITTNPPSANALVPPEGEENQAEPQWWTFADTFDPVACELVSTVRASKGYAGFDPPQQAVDDLLAWVRGFAPDDQVIRSVFDGFKERADAKRGKAEYTDVLRTLRNWFGSREAQWRSVRRQREIDSRHAAKSQSGGGVAQMYADAYNSFAEEAAS